MDKLSIPDHPGFLILFYCDGVDLQAHNGVSVFKVELFDLMVATKYNILLLTGFCIWNLSWKPKNGFHLCAHHFIIDLYFNSMEVKLALCWCCACQGKEKHQ